jgi:K+-transporting ATPase ATPase F chain
MDRGPGRVVGAGRRHGGRARPPDRAPASGGRGIGIGNDNGIGIGNAFGSTPVISLQMLYGFGGLIAVLLFAYLVFALICAEEF